MDWETYGANWPQAETSRFVQARPHRWHVQISGSEESPVVLLLHGTGGATHSWRDLMPLLSREYRVVAPDLPGHGFSRLGALQRSSIDLMAEDLLTLLSKLGLEADAVVGHSAGAALGLRLAQIAPNPPGAVVGLNAALDNFEGPASWLFPMMAKALAVNPFVAPTVARMASESSVRSLIEATGSRLDPLGIALYRACIADARHVDGALTMMAQWRLDGVRRAVPGTDLPVLLITGDADRAVPPDVSVRAAQRMPDGAHVSLPGLGHLAHEERPGLVAEQIVPFLKAHIQPTA